MATRYSWKSYYNNISGKTGWIRGNYICRTEKATTKTTLMGKSQEKWFVCLSGFQGTKYHKGAWLNSVGLVER